MLALTQHFTRSSANDQHHAHLLLASSSAEYSRKRTQPRFVDRGAAGFGTADQSATPRSSRTYPHSRQSLTARPYTSRVRPCCCKTLSTASRYNSTDNGLAGHQPSRFRRRVAKDRTPRGRAEPATEPCRQKRPAEAGRSRVIRDLACGTKLGGLMICPTGIG